jgi:RNA polymerase sigma-70 factor (ECF subfamily)
MSAPTPDLIPTRQSLLERLKQMDDQSSWGDFFETYWKLIYGVARKAGLSDAEAQDVVQDTIISVARKIPEFTYDPAAGSFKGWLMRLTRWRITDHYRKKHYESKGEWKPREQASDLGFLEQQPDPGGLDLEALWNEEWEKHVTEVALTKVRQSANPLQFQIFQLHVVNGVPATEVAARLGVKLPQVYFAKYKVTSLVRREVKRLEEKMV